MPIIVKKNINALVAMSWFSVATVCFFAVTGDAAPQANENRPKPSADEEVTILPFYDSADFTPRWIAPEKVPNDFHRIGDFSLIDQHAKRVTRDTLQGKIVVANFMFTTCPGICLKMTKSLNHLRSQIKAGSPNVLFVSHTVTPDADTPAVLNGYAKRHGAKHSEWLFLTGKRSSIYDLGRRHYFAEEELGRNKSDDNFLHSEKLILLDGKHRIRGIYNGLKKHDIALLSKDIELLRKEL